MKFVEIPNIPKGKASAVIADYRTDPNSVKTLNEIGIKVIFSCKMPSLYNAVNGHPDMMIHHLGENKFVAEPAAYGYFKSVIPNADIVMGSVRLTGKYPYDIAYNAAAVGDKLFCLNEYTAPEITANYENIISVKQGYSKCGICVVSQDAIITSDAGIYKAAVRNGVDALKIREGYIGLEGMQYGFIGGATGLISQDVLAVNGNIRFHPDCDLVRDFCKKHGVEIISLNDGEITDIGSIIPISE